MKRFVSIFIFVFLLFPMVVFAQNVEIKEVKLVEKSENAEVVNNPIIDGLSVKTDIRFNILFDYVKYKIIIKNKDNVDLNGFTQNGRLVNVGLVVVYGGSIDSSDVGINFKWYYPIYK